MTKDGLKDGFELARTGRTLPMALLRAREAVMERFRPLLLSHDVTEQQWRVLRVLQEVGETDASQLADRASILAPSLTRIIKTLETRGFIATRKDPDDGRRSLVTLSADGAGFIREVTPDSAAIYAEIEAKIGKDRVNALLDELDFLLQAMAKGDA